ncbi:MAG: oxygenase MpaB family protein [Polyangiaceae bacterium]
MRSAEPASRGDRREASLLGPGTASWESVGDRRFALMFGSAFALQLMHPQIASAVSTMSTFATDPWGRAERSLLSVQKWVYTGRGALDEGDRLLRMHRSIRGTDSAGRAFDALDEDAWAWVPLTSFYATVVGHPVFYGRPMTADEQQQIFDEMRCVCRILHVPEARLPKTVAEYWVYFDEMLSRLEDHPVVHTYISVVRDAAPPASLSPLVKAVWPLTKEIGARVSRLAIVGLLPAPAREKLNVPWTDEDARALARLGRVVSAVFPRLPERVRFMPLAYRARREAAEAARRSASPRGA